MTGLDSIAMAVAHLESKDDSGQAGEPKSDDDGPTPSSASFTDGQPRLVSSDAAAASDSQKNQSNEDAGNGESTLRHAESQDPKQEDLDNTTKGETCHDTTSVVTAVTGKTETKIAEHNPTIGNPAAMYLQQQQRPIALDLTTPPEATQNSMSGVNEGVTDYSKASLPMSLVANFSQQPARLPNQISQKILLKHQSVDGAADDPIAFLLSRISQITSDLPLLFRLMEELCELGVREHGPPAEVVANTVPIDKVERCDVLSGRGGETNHHYGNVQYRRIVKACQPAYLVAKRRDKPRVAASIVRVIRSRSGRFLKKDPKDNLWRDVGNNKAREKSSQALREGAPELRNLVQLPEQPNPPSNSPAPSPISKLTPSHVVYMNESTGQPVVRNVDSNLLTAMAMAGSSRTIPFGSYTGPTQPVESHSTVANAKSPGEIQAQLSGQSQAIYQQAIEQFEQLCGTKRSASVDGTADNANKKQRASEDEGANTPVDEVDETETLDAPQEKAEESSGAPTVEVESTSV